MRHPPKKAAFSAHFGCLIFLMRSRKAPAAMAGSERNSVMSAEEQRKVADEALLGERRLPDGGGAQHGMEQCRLLTTEKMAFCMMRLPLFNGQAAAQFEDQVREYRFCRGRHRCNCRTGCKGSGSRRILERVKPGGEDGADAAGVNLAEDVSADEAEDRADVEARARNGCTAAPA